MRTLNSKNEEKFFKQFPFLVSIFNKEAGRLAEKKYYKQKIQVSVADGSMLYTVPRFCLAPHWIGDLNRKYVGRYESVVFVLDSNNDHISRFQWGYDNKDTFIKQLVLGVNDVKTVVLLLKYHWWFEDKKWMEKGLDTYAGAFSHHEFLYYIYKEPKQGFEALINESDITKNVPIYDATTLAIVGCHKKNEATAAMAEIDKIISNFDNTIGKELWAELSKSKSSGLSGQFGNTRLMSFCSGGRIMLSFWSEKDQISVVGAESNYNGTGLQSMNCSIDRARAIVKDVIDNWKSGVMQTDNEVFYG